jgi:hypothetical protein
MEEAGCLKKTRHEAKSPNVTIYCIDLIFSNKMGIWACMISWRIDAVWLFLRFSLLIVLSVAIVYPFLSTSLAYGIMS